MKVTKEAAAHLMDCTHALSDGLRLQETAWHAMANSWKELLAAEKPASVDYWMHSWRTWRRCAIDVARQIEVAREALDDAHAVLAEAGITLDQIGWEL